MTDINIHKLVEEADGNLVKLYDKLLAANNGDFTATRKTIEKLLVEEKAKLAEAETNYQKGVKYLAVAKSLEDSRKERMEATKAEYAAEQAAKLAEKEEND